MIKILTVDLKEILSKVGKCASNDKTAPITQLLNIKSDGHSIKFTTTDEINTCIYTYTSEQGNFEELDVTVMADQFAKLISKFTSSDVTLKLSKTKNELVVRGNGEYKVSLPMEGGNPIEYPVVDEGALTAATDVFNSDISFLINAAKNSEGAITKITPDIQLEDYPRTNYYFSNTGCVTLDGFKATWVKEEGLLPFTTLVYPSTIKLLPILGVGTTTEVFKTESNDIVFKTPTITIISKEAQGLDAFPYEIAVKLIETPVENKVDVAANGFISALDRLKLFISNVDGNCVKLTFGDKGLIASVNSDTCSEQISSEPLSAYMCYIDIDNLVAQLKSFNDEVVTLGYGNEAFIQLANENIGQIIVSSTDDE